MDSLTPASRLPTDMELRGRREGGGMGVLGGGGGRGRGGREEGKRVEGGGGEAGGGGGSGKGEGERGIQYIYYNQKNGRAVSTLSSEPGTGL